jgi:hypothetical protein
VQKKEKRKERTRQELMIMNLDLALEARAAPNIDAPFEDPVTLNSIADVEG